MLIVTGMLRIQGGVSDQTNASFKYLMTKMGGNPAMQPLQ